MEDFTSANWDGVERRSGYAKDLRKRFDAVFLLGAGTGLIGGIALGVLLLLAIQNIFGK